MYRLVQNKIYTHPATPHVTPKAHANWKRSPRPHPWETETALAHTSGLPSSQDFQRDSF
jgi:hypothetical protein